MTPAKPSSIEHGRRHKDGRVRTSVAEVLRQDLIIESGTVKAFRVRLGISFKYESET